MHVMFEETLCDIEDKYEVIINIIYTHDLIIFNNRITFGEHCRKSITFKKSMYRFNISRLSCTG